MTKLMVLLWVLHWLRFLANLFMAHHEEIWIEEFLGSKPSFYSRYVDDIFAVFDSENEALNFFNYINNKHQNIKFTMEKEIDRKLAFLDVFIDISEKFTPKLFFDICFDIGLTSRK